MVRYLWSRKDYWSRKGQPYSYLPFVAWQFHGLMEETSNMICCWAALLSVGQRSMSNCNCGSSTVSESDDALSSSKKCVSLENEGPGSSPSSPTLVSHRLPRIQPLNIPRLNRQKTR